MSRISSVYLLVFIAGAFLTAWVAYGVGAVAAFAVAVLLACAALAGAGLHLLYVMAVQLLDQVFSRR